LGKIKDGKTTAVLLEDIKKNGRKKKNNKVSKTRITKKKTTIATGMQGQRVAVEMGRMGSSVVWFFFLAVLLYLCL
jgi:hypothetical protein